MPNKHYNLEQIKNSNIIFKNPDYCSFCAGYKSKMLNHKIAHKLRALDDSKANLAFFWYVQDITLPDHLRPTDPRTDSYIFKKKRKEMVIK